MEAIKGKIQGVRIQDLVLTTVCVLFIYLLRTKNHFVLTPAWHKHQDQNAYTNGKYPNADESLPRPIVTDFEGDGVMELLFITNLLELVVTKYHKGITKNNIRQLPQLDVMYSVQLPVIKEEDGQKGFPVAMETGFLEQYQSMVQVRTQVIVVVLDDWQVLCYNTSLALQWQRQLMDVGQMREHYSVTAMGILIAPTKLRKEDSGLVVVGGAFGHRDHEARMKKLQGEQGNQARMHQAGNLNQVTEDPATHFSTFALSGNDGTVRWHHLPGDFERKRDQSEREPHHWKLQLKTGQWHVGEAPWGKYGENLLKHMPHQWSSLHDTRLDLANVRKLEQAPPTAAEGSSVPPTPPLMDIIGGLDDVHIPGYAYGGLRPHARHEHIKHPTAVIIHSHKGVEVLSLETGQPLTRLKLDEGASVHVDVNEDGTLEEVVLSRSGDECYGQVYTVQPHPHSIFSEPVCKAMQWWGSEVFSSVVDVAEDERLTVAPVVVKSIANRRGILTHLLGKTLRSERKGYDSIFVTSTGRVTSYGPLGELHWQVVTPAHWGEMTLKAMREPHTEDVDVYNNAFKPSALAFAPKVYGPETMAVISGWDTVALIDLRDGHLLGQHSLPCQPTDRPVIADFNEDGMSDLIISCPSGYVGFTVTTQPPYMYMSIVSITVILSVLLLSWCCRPEEDTDSDSQMDYDVH